MTILITGVTGFIGRHLARALQDAGRASVWGLARAPAGASPLDAPERLLPGDVTDAAWVRQALTRLRPAQCFHLAGQSRDGASWRDPRSTYDVNVGGQLNVLEALREAAPACRVLIASSSAAYGFMPGERLAETQALQPVSPYGVSKAAQDLMGRQYARSEQLSVLVTRNFNVIGPGQPARFAVSSFARQIAEAEAGLRPPVLEVGNLDVARDFLDVRDLVRAWQLILAQGQSGEAYNVASGRVRSLRVVVDLLLAQAAVPVQVKAQRRRWRNPATDPPVLRADIGKLRALGSWTPAWTLERTLRDLLDHWRARVAAAPVPAR